MTAGIDALSAADLQSLPDVALAAELVSLHQEMNRLEAQWLRRLEVFDRRGGAAADGSASTAAWLRQRCHIAPGEAVERVRCARHLVDALPGTAAALAAGDVSYRHAAVLTRPPLRCHRS